MQVFLFFFHSCYSESNYFITLHHRTSRHHFCPFFLHSFFWNLFLLSEFKRHLNKYTKKLLFFTRFWHRESFTFSSPEHNVVSRSGQVSHRMSQKDYFLCSTGLSNSWEHLGHSSLRSLLFLFFFQLCLKVYEAEQGNHFYIFFLLSNKIKSQTSNSMLHWLIRLQEPRHCKGINDQVFLRHNTRKRTTCKM